MRKIKYKSLRDKTLFEFYLDCNWLLTDTVNYCDDDGVEILAQIYCMWKYEGVKVWL